MQLRFIAAAGDREGVDALARRLANQDALDLRQVLRRPRLGVWVIEGTPHAVSQDKSAIALGLVFARAEGGRVAQLPQDLPAPEDFVARYWGAYVLIAREGDDGYFVLRDPSGGMTAYRWRMNGLHVYASDAALLALAVKERLEPNAEFLRQWLTFPSFRSSATGVAKVAEIVPGSLHRVSGPGAGRVALAWSPWDHARPSVAVEDFFAATRLLREELLRTVPALVCDEDAILRLSGGLDSSILAAALAHGGRRFGAVTYATRAPEGDERAYARRVADHLGSKLFEIVEGTTRADLYRVDGPSLRPPHAALLQPLRRALADHIAEAGAALVVDGAGGDNVFCHLHSASPALDALSRRGPRAALATLGDLARLHGTTAWSAGRAAWRRSRKPLVWWPRDEQFLAPGAALQLCPDHPWLVSKQVHLRGTVEHVQSIVAIHSFLDDPVPGRPATLHPLLAQPVLEACLRIPSWLWVRGGRDRAVARAAIDALLPPAILSRRSKGHLAGQFRCAFGSLRPQLGELLLDGRLAAMGVLDRDGIWQYLHRAGEPADSDYMRLFDLASAEAWLRGFEG